MLEPAKKVNSNAAFFGNLAFYLGKTIYENPHVINSEDYKLWESAYKSAAVN
jgi:hypothetical protein